MKYIPFLICLSLSGFKPVHKLSPEQSKHLKPPLTAQHYTEKAKQPTGSKTFKKVDTEDKHITSRTTQSYMPPKDK